MAQLIIFLIPLILKVQLSTAQTILSADGNADNTYSLINNVLGGGGTAVEVPDCAHPSFGSHISQLKDDELGRPVFVFYAHITPTKDNDRCDKTDRQRTEIKTFSKSPKYLKGYHGESVNFSWNFKLDSGFKASTAFTHIHQIKAGDGDDGTPIITLSPRAPKSSKKGTSTMEIIHVDSKGDKSVVGKTDLNPFLGQWIHVNEKITYYGNGESGGKYFVEMVRLKDKKRLISYSNEDIDLWRDKTTFVRPKWGIYRSLGDVGKLRNEAVLFDNFCLAKGNDKCN